MILTQKLELMLQNDARSYPVGNYCSFIYGCNLAINVLGPGVTLLYWCKNVLYSTIKQNSSSPQKTDLLKISLTSRTHLEGRFSTGEPLAYIWNQQEAGIIAEFNQNFVANRLDCIVLAFATKTKVLGEFICVRHSTLETNLSEIEVRTTTFTHVTLAETN